MGEGEGVIDMAEPPSFFRLLVNHYLPPISHNSFLITQSVSHKSRWRYEYGAYNITFPCIMGTCIDFPGTPCTNHTRAWYTRVYTHTFIYEHTPMHTLAWRRLPSPPSGAWGTCLRNLLGMPSLFSQNTSQGDNIIIGSLPYGQCMAFFGNVV